MDGTTARSWSRRRLLVALGVGATVASAIAPTALAVWLRQGRTSR